MISLKSVHELERLPSENEWLIGGLWPSQGVGIIAAEPKCGKTWLAMEMAISVASGMPCLGEFQVPSTAPVLFFNAEDGEHIQRDRLANIMRAKGLSSQDVSNLKIVRSENLRLDIDEDINALRELVAKTSSKLLILDPFVRLHRIDENNSGAVAELLGRLRAIQRDFGTAVILVHHLKKSGGRNARGGSKLRGSSEFFAWGDSYVTLKKSRNEEILMDIELRAAPGKVDIPLELISVNSGTHLQDVSPLP